MFRTDYGREHGSFLDHRNCTGLQTGAAHNCWLIALYSWKIQQREGIAECQSRRFLEISGLQDPVPHGYSTSEVSQNWTRWNLILKWYVMVFQWWENKNANCNSVITSCTYPGIVKKHDLNTIITGRPVIIFSELLPGFHGNHNI